MFPYAFHITPTVLSLTQAHLVAAFEQSLGNMTIRLKSLTLTAEQKVEAASPVLQLTAHLISPLRISGFDPVGIFSVGF